MASWCTGGQVRWRLRGRCYAFPFAEGNVQEKQRCRMEQVTSTGSEAGRGISHVESWGLGTAYQRSRRWRADIDVLRGSRGIHPYIPSFRNPQRLTRD